MADRKKHRFRSVHKGVYRNGRRGHRGFRSPMRPEPDTWGGEPG